MKSKLPMVSTITPSFNQAEFIEETILSVKNQNYPNVEHIVVDGGSTDGIIDILKKYPHLIWISEPDKGQAEAINKGFKMAKGEIIGWLNSDDTYTIDAVETSVKFLVEHPDVSMVYGYFNEIDNKGSIIRTIRSQEFDLIKLFEGNFVPQPTVFLKRKILEETGLLDVNLHYVMDYDLWIRVGMRFKIQHIPVILVNFRLHPRSKTVSNESAFIKEREIVIKNILLNQDKIQETERFKHKDIKAILLSSLAVCYFQQRQFKEAIEELNKALSLEPEDRSVKSNIIFHKGMVYLDQKRYDKAIENFEEIISNESEDKNIRINAMFQKGRAYQLNGQLEEAIREYKRVLFLKPEDRYIEVCAQYNIGSIYKKRDQIKEALESFQKVIELIIGFPDSGMKKIEGNAHFYLGCIYQRMGEIEEARQHFGECLKLIPDHKKARENLEKIPGIKEVSER